MKKNERNYKKYLQPEHKLKIHNITSIIDKRIYDRLLKYLNAKRIVFFYGYSNGEFGLRVTSNNSNKGYDLFKRDIVIKYLVKKYNLMNWEIKKLKTYPQINVMSMTARYKQNKRQKYLYRSFDTSFFKMHFIQNSIGLK